MRSPEQQKSAAALKIRRFSCPEQRGAVSRIDGGGPIGLYLAVRPAEGDDFEAQARGIYQNLHELLQGQGARLENVITEKVFLSDLKHQIETFRQVRAECYGPEEKSRPATTYLQQLPCEPGVLCELQARVIIPTESEEVVIRDLESLPAPAAGKVVSFRGYDQIYLHNLTGGRPGDGLDFAAQMEQVFDLAETVLEQEKLKFRDVVRTWIYVDEMERDYAALNKVRTAFFERQGVKRLPASTGIQGGVFPCDRAGALDLYAIRTERPVQIELMHARTLNEAPSYGSRFARGITVTREDRRVAYLSGTASIDDQGEVVHVGEIEGQVRRMLLNVEELLQGSGAALSDVVRATTYLKNPRDLDCFRRVCAERGFPADVPHTVCRADVCRPEWLCEMEAEAIYPAPRGASEQQGRAEIPSDL